MEQLMIFEGNNVEVFEHEGQVLFNPKHVAECLGIKNVNDNISRMNEKQVVKLTNSDIGITDIRKLNNAGENFLTESGVYKLIFKSNKPNAEKFQDWVTDKVLPDIRKTGAYSTNKTKVGYLQTLEGAKFIADDLRVNEASRILMYNKVCKANGVDTSFLPAYTEEQVTKSLTVLLKENSIDMGAVKFNTLLVENGYLEEKTRPSTKGDKNRKYKQLTEKGLRYGKNLINPHNQKETQPHYYEDVFKELVEGVLF
jgi:prophage antirepressor-like protein